MRGPGSCGSAIMNCSLTPNFPCPRQVVQPGAASSAGPTMHTDLVQLEDLTPGARVRGVLPDRPVTVVQVEWHGTDVITLTYRDDHGRTDHELLYRDNENRLAVEEKARPW